MFTSESVTEGHPDKVADQISDAILDAILAQDSEARVACETFVTPKKIIIAGEITAKADMSQINEIVRKTVAEIGYDAETGFDGETVEIENLLIGQSPDIAMGVNAGGAGDQGMMFGFACAETPELMPAPIQWAHNLARQLATVRKNGTLSYLRPDGKTQVTVEYNAHKPIHIDKVLISTHHAVGMDQDLIKQDLIKYVIIPVLGDLKLIDDTTEILVNPTGKFEVGGPAADTGLTGRKIIVDTYGGMASHGGGAFSGKDPTKVDRSAAYMMRYIAKNIVAAGIAERLQLEVAYAIGKAEPLSICVETYGTGKISDDDIDKLIRKYFDLRPLKIIEKLQLRKPQYRDTAAYGHFGRTDLNVKWEDTDMAVELAKAAGTVPIV
ncbi:MAG: methionine adenosyltransferase [bacterium]